MGFCAQAEPESARHALAARIAVPNWTLLSISVWFFSLVSGPYKNWPLKLHLLLRIRSVIVALHRRWQFLQRLEIGEHVMILKNRKILHHLFIGNL